MGESLEVWADGELVATISCPHCAGGIEHGDLNGAAAWIVDRLVDQGFGIGDAERLAYVGLGPEHSRRERRAAIRAARRRR